MTIDYYAEAREIAMELARDGLANEAQALADTLESGASGTEILMALRWQLARMDESNPATSLQTRRRIRVLSNAIKGALVE